MLRPGSLHELLVKLSLAMKVESNLAKSAACSYSSVSPSSARWRMLGLVFDLGTTCRDGKVRKLRQTLWRQPPIQGQCRIISCSCSVGSRVDCISHAVTVRVGLSAGTHYDLHVDGIAEQLRHRTAKERARGPR